MVCQSYKKRFGATWICCPVRVRDSYRPDNHSPPPLVSHFFLYSVFYLRLRLKLTDLNGLWAVSRWLWTVFSMTLVYKLQLGLSISRRFGRFLLCCVSVGRSEWCAGTPAVYIARCRQSLRMLLFIHVYGSALRVLLLLTDDVVQGRTQEKLKGWPKKISSSVRPSPRPRRSARRKTASSLILRGHF